MAKRFFDSCTTLEELKKEYRRLTLKYHPDLGGDTRIMQDINAMYDRLFNQLKDKHNNEQTNGKTVTETSQQSRAIIEALLKLDGVEVEICGTWLWIGGNTFANKEALKALGCRWSKSKKLWYWTSEKLAGCKRGKSMKAIRETYGSEVIGTGKGEAQKLIA